jgi:hypothetical protein
MEGLGQLKNLIRNRTRDLPVCSIAPQPTKLSHADEFGSYSVKNLSEISAIVTAGFPCFLQSVQANNGAALRSGHNGTFQIIFKFIIHQLSYHSMYMRHKMSCKGVNIQGKLQSEKAARN